MTDELSLATRSIERKQGAFLVVALFAMLAVSVALNKIEREAQAEQAAQFIAKKVVSRDFREIHETIETALAAGFQVIRYFGTNGSPSFAVPSSAELNPNDSIFARLASGKVGFRLQSLNGFDSEDRIEFEYSRTHFFVPAVTIWIVLVLLSVLPTRLMKRRMALRLDQQLAEKAAIESDRARGELSKIVRHNIRTPLSVLMRLSSTLSAATPSEQKLLREAIDQIKGLVSSLGRDVAPNANSELAIADVVMASARESGLAISGRATLQTSIEDSVYSARVRFDPVELRALIANLIFNAFEAEPRTGLIDLKISDLGNAISIAVSDDGVGIPERSLPHVKEKGFSERKRNGSGLGLYHADQCARAWKGRLEIASTVDQGTTAQLSLPIAEREPWYVLRLKLAQSDRVVYLDDQPAARALFASVIRDAGFEGELVVCDSPNEFRKALHAPVATQGRLHAFADYDLGLPDATGVDALNSIHDADFKCLVTGHFDDVSVRAVCSQNAIGLLAKTSLGEIPIVVRN